MRHPLVLIASALSLVGCAEQSLLRWSDATGIDDHIAQPALIVSSQAADPSAPLTAKTLPERASAAYITALAAREKDPDKLRALMAAPIRKAGDAGDSPTKFARVMVIGIQRRDIRPADRFAMTKVEVRPVRLPEDAVLKNADRRAYRFTDYQSASTDYTSINIGAVAISNQVSSSVGVTPTFGGATSPTAAASLGLVSSDTSTHNISERAQLSVNVAPDDVTILRTGAEGLDLTGNTLVKLALQFPETSAVRHYLVSPDILDKSGRPKPPGKSDLKIKLVQLIPAHDIYACAQLSYVDRVVESGAQYRDEGKQKIEFLPGKSNWGPFLIASRAEMNTPLWVIMDKNAALMVNTGLNAVPMEFDDYDTIVQFLDWLKVNRTAAVGKSTIEQFHGATRGPLSQFDDLHIVRFATDADQMASQDCAYPD